MPTALYASHGYAGFSLAYFNYETLPEILAEVPLEYFETAIGYLQSRDDTDGQRMAITGASRGGELSLLLGTIFPQYKVIIAISPSSIIFTGFGDESPEGSKPAWFYKGEAIPFKADDPELFAYSEEYASRGEAIPLTLGFTERLRRKPEAMKRAQIPVEKINGAVLMTSGQDDQMWPSSQFAEIAMRRLRAHNFAKPFVHLSYPGVGHRNRPPYFPTTDNIGQHPVDGALYALGGNPEAIYRASVDSWQKMLDFLKRHL